MQQSPSDGASGVLSFEVTLQDTAPVLGSGDVEVLATPRLLAWCEAATCREAERAGVLPAGSTGVGRRVVLEHLLPTPVGGRVRVEARLVEVRGRALTFTVSATDRAGRTIAEGEVQRVVVDAAAFTARVPGP